MGHHVLKSNAQTCHWGYFEARRAPVMTIDSGDTVTIETLSGGPDVVPKGDFIVPPELADVHANCSDKMIPGHILTGPVGVCGAKPGTVLEVRIKDVALRQNWGWNRQGPLVGALPNDFHESRLLTIPLDRQRHVGALPWGLELNLRPFFGVMGTSSSGTRLPTRCEARIRRCRRSTPRRRGTPPPASR